MSEKDKMLAGILYDANNDKELIKDRCKAKDICFEYNFFDQAHFIKDFKQFTGDTPEHFKRFL